MMFFNLVLFEYRFEYLCYEFFFVVMEEISREENKLFWLLNVVVIEIIMVLYCIIL